jgi:hypothetical protein
MAELQRGSIGAKESYISEDGRFYGLPTSESTNGHGSPLLTNFELLWIDLSRASAIRVTRP